MSGRGRRWESALVVAGSLAAALGWWLPWVLARSGAAALVLLGLDLGDFWKFTNEWRHLGLFQGERLAFFLPAPLAAMLLAVWIAGRTGWGRWLLLPLLAFLSLVILPAPDLLPHILATPALLREFTFQLLLAPLTLLVILLIPLWQRLGAGKRRGIIIALALAGATLPAWALWRTWLILQGFYGGAALLGPGPLLTSAGFLLVALAAGAGGRTNNQRDGAEEPS